MSLIISGLLFFISLFLLSVFLLYKRVEQFMEREFRLSNFLRSFDVVIRKVFLFFRNYTFSYKERVNLFLLNWLIYPFQRMSRRFKFRLSSWYYHFLEKLRQKHMARYKKQASLYLRTISSDSNKKNNR
jgi:hypothetical protein